MTEDVGSAFIDVEATVLGKTLGFCSKNLSAALFEKAVEMNEVQSPTLDALVGEAIANALTSESIAKRVQVAAEKAVGEAIDSAFSYGSKFRKGIEESIKQVLPITDADDLAVFGNAVRVLIQRRLATLASETASEHLKGVLDHLFPDGRDVTMKELRKAYIEKLKSEASRSDCSCDEGDYEPEYTWKEETGSHGKYWDLWMSAEDDASRYSGKDVITLRFRPVDGAIDLHECWNASVGRTDMQLSSLFMGPLFGFDAMVFRLATGTARLRK